ncbi:hypothetical protein Pla52o_43720 [Novipirellula galeiformis]|uniref:Uncharacterized protein n=1 Tax=Novipirellula galeiformis TaxID=2528004 RepID=A0A5C6CAS2_9BACT|nr:hypothetical protein Pla52o_43720 [Novipirellula galeiformis]
MTASAGQTTTSSLPKCLGRSLSTKLAAFSKMTWDSNRSCVRQNAVHRRATRCTSKLKMLSPHGVSPMPSTLAPQDPWQATQRSLSGPKAQQFAQPSPTGQVFDAHEPKGQRPGRLLGAGDGCELSTGPLALQFIGFLGPSPLGWARQTSGALPLNTKAQRQNLRVGLGNIRA